jgi:hypothetical protein
MNTEMAALGLRGVSVVFASGDSGYQVGRADHQGAASASAAAAVWCAFFRAAKRAEASADAVHHTVHTTRLVVGARCPDMPQPARSMARRGGAQVQQKFGAASPFVTAVGGVYNGELRDSALQARRSGRLPAPFARAARRRSLRCRSGRFVLGSARLFVCLFVCLASIRAGPARASFDCRRIL